MANKSPEHRPTFCVVAASPLTVQAFLQGHIKGLAKTGNVEVLSDFRLVESDSPFPRNVVQRQIAIPRRIAPLADILALCRLWRTFRSVRPTLVFSITAKTGLLAMSAAFLAGIRIRVHCFTGQAWADKQGFGRWALKSADRLTAKLATHLLADSPTQRDFLESQHVVARGRIHVPASGSISGVDCARFKPDAAMRKAIRQRFNLLDDDILILFLARVKRSKGVLELLEAFEALAAAHPKLHLAIIGPDEENLDPVISGSALSKAGRVHRVSKFVQQHQEYLQASDIFCLPSHYEGFGSIVIEAGACGLPTIAANVYGLTDAVANGLTGLLHCPGDIKDITRQLALLINDDALRLRLGEQARNRAQLKFDQRLVIAEYVDYISNISSVSPKV